MRRRRYRIERSPPQADAGADLGFVRVETRSLPALTHVLPPISTSRFAHLCRSRPHGSIRSLLPSSLYLDHSHCPVLAPATLAALPSTRAIETRSLPSSLAATNRGFAFYV